MKNLRWKKVPKEIGLARVGAGKYRASIYHDGKTEYARVYPSGGNWRGPLKGWYFVVSTANFLMNTCNSLVQEEAQAKEAAEKFVKTFLNKE